MQRVAVSILNYNSAASTVACVKSLLNTAPATGIDHVLDIFVMDNASGENDAKQLCQVLKETPAVHLQINNENLGFAAGHNRNLQFIFAASSPDFVWLLNSDCLVEEKTLPALLKCCGLQPEVGIWGATLLESGGRTVQCAGGCFYNSWVSSYRRHGRGRPVARIGQLKAGGFDYIDGASMFFPVATLQRGLKPAPGSGAAVPGKKFQWLNEDFFLFFEELDLVQRLRPGLKLAWCKDAYIQHEGGVSLGTSGNRRSALAEYHSTLSALKFTRMHYPRRLWVMIPVRYLSKSLLLLMRGDFQLLGSTTQAYRDFFK